MSRRAMSFVAAILLSAITVSTSAYAQDKVPLRASHQGQFLPEGTEVVVLTREGGIQRDGRYQPEFLPFSEFPLHGSLVRTRDRLGGAGRTSRAYDRTQDSGLLYFIYALAPDSALYWSYSVQRDSLKFDVVDAGVMSVAPVESKSVRNEVLDLIFRRRVTVYMPSERTGSRDRGPEEADDDGEAGREERGAALAAAHDSVSVPGETASNSEPGESVFAAQTPSIAVVDSGEAPRDRGGMLPSVAFFVTALLLLSVAAIAAAHARNYRRELKQVRREMLRLKARDDGNMEQELQRRLEQAELRYQMLAEEYDVLQARYSALERAFDPQRA